MPKKLLQRYRNELKNGRKCCTFSVLLLKIQIWVYSLMYVKKQGCLRTQWLKTLVGFNFRRNFAPENKAQGAG